MPVYLYGSAENGVLRVDSDEDLAVLPRRPIEPMRRFEAAQELARTLHREVDLVDLPRAPAFLRGQAVGTGRCLFHSGEEEVGLFEAHSLSDYPRLHEETREVIRSFDDRYRS
ncbi:MAG: nucleotidyltransferase domain-containing protein [Planctomycetota bacterium]